MAMDEWMLVPGEGSVSRRNRWLRYCWSAWRIIWYTACKNDVGRGKIVKVKVDMKMKLRGIIYS